jgi:acetyl esterase
MSQVSAVTLRPVIDELADDELTTFLRDFNARGVPSAAATGAEALRAGTAARVAMRPKGPEMASVRDLALPGAEVVVRLYRPSDEATAMVVFLHGGGWVIGDLETHDRACRRLAASSGVSVLAVDYRRAPEHRWPAAVDDAVAALKWVASRPPELDPQPTAVAIAGDSAGGTTATLACLRVRDEQPELAPLAQLLVYANTDLSLTEVSGGSMQTEGHGYGLEVGDIAWFNSQWVPDPQLRSDPRVSPLAAADLSGLPTAVVVTCEHDPLRDQGEAYARRLADAGVPTMLRREAGMVHNFLLWDTISPACAAAGDRVGADLRVALAS